MEEENFREFNLTNQLSMEITKEEEIIKELEKEKNDLMNLTKLKSQSKAKYFED